MADSPSTKIPLIPPGTLDVPTAANAAFEHIDGLLQAAVLSIEDDPPGSPANGDQYIVGTGTGDWLGKDEWVARYVSEGDFWKFYEPGVEVREVINLDALEKLVYDESGGWVVIGGLTDAPSDGSTYGRKDGAWSAVAGDRSTVTSVSSSSGVVTLNYALGDYFTITLTENVTSWVISNPPGSGKGFSLMVQITQDSTPRTVAKPGTTAGGTALDVSTGSGDVDLLAISSFNNGTTLRSTIAKDFS